MKEFKDIQSFVTNCYADMEVVNFLLYKIPNYHDHLITRHHKFVDSYMRYKNLKMVSTIYNYNEKDMLRIFWRIQKKLLLAFIELAYKGKFKKINDVPETFDSFLLWQLEQFREDGKAVYDQVKRQMNKEFVIDGVSETRKKQIEFVLNTLSFMEDLEDILPANVYSMLNDLINGMPLTKMVEKHKKNLNYVVTSIIGRKNPRSKTERGWLSYLGDQNIDFNMNKNIIQFPLR